MTLRSPLWQQNGDYSAQEDRQTMFAVGDAGVVGPGALAVTQRAAGANMTVDVAPGRCIIAGLVGSYLCWSDAVESVAIDAAPSVGNSRIDVVYAQVRDSEVTGSDDDWVIQVAKGTASSSPSVPALPTFAIALARVTLTSSTTSITDGIIADARRLSASPADQIWPLPSSVVLGSEPVANSAETWGSVTIPSPNRPVRIVAWVSGEFSAASGTTLAIGEMAIRVTIGGGVPVSSDGRRGRSADEFDPVPTSQTFVVNATPGVGEDIVVAARIICGAATPAPAAVFDRGFLHVLVFPRP